MLARGKPAGARQSHCWGSQVSGGHPGRAPSSLIRYFSLASIIHSYTEARVLFPFANPNTLPAENTPRIKPMPWVHHPLMRHPSPILSFRLVSPELSFLLQRSLVPFKAGLSSHCPLTLEPPLPGRLLLPIRPEGSLPSLPSCLLLGNPTASTHRSPPCL